MPRWDEDYLSAKATIALVADEAGAPFTTKYAAYALAFDHNVFAGDANVSRLLSAMAREGLLMRISRGLYCSLKHEPDVRLRLLEPEWSTSEKSSPENPVKPVFSRDGTYVNTSIWRVAHWYAKEIGREFTRADFMRALRNDHGFTVHQNLVRTSFQTSAYHKELIEVRPGVYLHPIYAAIFD